MKAIFQAFALTIGIMVFASGIFWALTRIAVLIDPLTGLGICVLIIFLGVFSICYKYFKTM